MSTDDLGHSEDPLHRTETSAENAITLARKNKQEAVRMLAEATPCRNVTPGNLRSAIAELSRLLEKLNN
jgi:hypothetical protein